MRTAPPAERPAGARSIRFTARTRRILAVLLVAAILPRRSARLDEAAVEPRPTFAVHARALCGRAIAYSYDPEDGGPVAGVRLDLPGGPSGPGILTDDRGIASFDWPRPGEIVASRGAERRTFRLGSPPSEEDLVAHIATDRPVYLAGQTVRWKAVLRGRRGALLSIPRLERVPWTVFGPDSAVVAEGDAELGPLGTAAGTVALPDARPAGFCALVLGVRGRPWRPWFRASAEEPFPFHATGFRVRRRCDPGLDLALEVDRDPARLARGIRGSLRVSAPSGDPPADVEADWCVVARYRARPDAGGAWDPDDSLYLRPVTEYILSPAYGVASPKRPGAAELLLDDLWNRRLFRREGPGGCFAIEDVWLHVSARDAQGRTGAAFSRLEGVPTYPRRGPEWDTGEADDFEEDTKRPPPPVDSDLEGRIETVVPDRKVYEPGSEGKLLVRSTFRGQAALLVAEAEGYLVARPIRLESGADVVTFEVPADAFPSLTLRILAWKRGEERCLGHFVDIRVSTRGRALSVAVDARASRALAAGLVRVRVTTALPDGNPVPAEVELTIADEGGYRLAPDATLDPRRVFHGPWRPWSAWGGTEPRTDGEWLGSCFHEGGEEGLLRGSVEGDLDAVWDQREWPVPFEVPEPAYWNPRVTTGPDGVAEVEVELPVGPATWRIAARAVSGADRFGWGVGRLETVAAH